MKKIIVSHIQSVCTVGVLCASLVLSTIVHAKTPDNTLGFDASTFSKGEHRQHHNLDKMTKALSLTAQQQVQIKAIKAQAKSTKQALRGFKIQFRQNEKDLIQAETFDEKAFNELYETYQQHFAEVAMSKAKARHAIFNVLTTEQKSKWQQIKMSKKARRGR